MPGLTKELDDLLNNGNGMFILPGGPSNVYQAIASSATIFTDQNQRYQKIFGMSREIVMESKRIINHLQNIKSDNEEPRRTRILAIAEQRIDKLLKTDFRRIASELKGHDQYLYNKAYTAAMQEFIEALCFFRYLKYGGIDTVDKIKEQFEYADGPTDKKCHLLVMPLDIIIGIVDFTSDLMKKCVIKLSIGETDGCAKLCELVRTIYMEILSISGLQHQTFSRKVAMLQENLRKMDLLAYNISVHGSEIPKEILVTIMESQPEETSVQEEEEDSE